TPAGWILKRCADYLKRKFFVQQENEEVLDGSEMSLRSRMRRGPVGLERQAMASTAPDRARFGSRRDDGRPLVGAARGFQGSFPDPFSRSLLSSSSSEAFCRIRLN